MFNVVDSVQGGPTKSLECKQNFKGRNRAEENLYFKCK